MMKPSKKILGDRTNMVLDVVDQQNQRKRDKKLQDRYKKVKVRKKSKELSSSNKVNIRTHDRTFHAD